MVAVSSIFSLWRLVIPIPVKYCFSPFENVPFLHGIVEYILKIYLGESDQMKIDHEQFILLDLSRNGTSKNGSRPIENFIEADEI